MLCPNPLSEPLPFIPPLTRAQPGSARQHPARAIRTKPRQGPCVIGLYGFSGLVALVASFEPREEGLRFCLIGPVDRRERLHPVDFETGGDLCGNVAVGLEQSYGVDGPREFGLGGAFPENRDFFVFIVRIGGEDLGEERAKGAVPGGGGRRRNAV